MSKFVRAAWVVAALLAACGRRHAHPGGGTTSGELGGDAGVVDAGDAGGAALDAGSVLDGGVAVDAGVGGTDGGLADAGAVDAGAADAGDAGVTDGGVADAGTSDGGAADGGVIIADAGVAVVPSGAGWQFFGPQQGLPAEIYGVTADQGGNLWVAGGEAGLFLLRPGDTRFSQLGLTDGLHPYGYLADGGPSTTAPYLKVISVAGGPAGTVFVGYAGIGGEAGGKPAPAGTLGCEDNYDGPNPDPAIYKSGDADKVTLTATGIAVDHYDISSGAGIVPAEPRGREKLCDVHRIVYDARTASVWFGGNHGFAWGDPAHGSAPDCNGGLACSGVVEHAHPGINGWKEETKQHEVFLTGGYWGVAVDQNSDVWFGGYLRTTHFLFGTNYFCLPGATRCSHDENAFWPAQAVTESSTDHSDRLDLWPDPVGEPGIPTPSQRRDDLVSAIAVADDHNVWVGSFSNGLLRLTPSGAVNTDATGLLANPDVGSLAFDSTGADGGTIWVGHRWAGGLERVAADVSQAWSFGQAALGAPLLDSPVLDIQIDRSQSQRRVLVAFFGANGVPATVGIYSGP